MKLFDSADRREIELGLLRVFEFDVQRINRVIAAQVRNVKWCKYDDCP